MGVFAPWMTRRHVLLVVFLHCSCRAGKHVLRVRAGVGSAAAPVQQHQSGHTCAGSVRHAHGLNVGWQQVQPVRQHSGQGPILVTPARQMCLIAQTQVQGHFVRAPASWSWTQAWLVVRGQPSLAVVCQPGERTSGWQYL